MHSPQPGLKHYIVLFFVAIALTSTLFNNSCLAQSSHQIFEHLTTEDGLSSNKVEAILQDREGFYWIATQNGLNRFDGTTFKIFQHLPGDSTSLTHNYCTALAEDKNGDIWVATYKGISRYVKSKGSFQRIYLEHPTRNFEITNRIYNLALDAEGNIWIAGNGLWKYNVDDENVFLFKNDKSDVSTIPFYQLITQLLYDPVLNGLWFITGKGLVFVDTQTNKFYHKDHNPLGWKIFDHADSREITINKKNRLWFRDDKTQSLSYFESEKNEVTLTSKKITEGVKHITSDDNNRIWIFYWLAQAEIFDPLTGSTDREFFTAHHGRSPVSEQGSYLFIDKQKNHWIASGKGISIYNISNQFYKLHQLKFNDGAIKEPVKINAITQIIPDEVWVATNKGLFNYNLKSSVTRHVNILAPASSLTTLCADADKVWIGFSDQLWCFDTKSEKVIRKIQLQPGVFFIKKGKADDLWIGLWMYGLYRFNKKTGDLTWYSKNNNNIDSSIKSNNLITGYYDQDNLWIGYNAGVGFSKHTISDGQWEHFHPQENDLSNSNAGTITVISKDLKGQLWLGTHGSGIFQFDPIANTYINYEQSQGINSNYINSIIPDGLGNLWISTADGMNFLSIEKNTIVNLDMGLVFSDNDFAANGIVGMNDKLFFFCNNEIVEVDPSAYKPDYNFPQLVISNFKIFDKPSSLRQQDDGIHLSYRENFFSFEFSTIKTQPDQEVKYAYMLEGFDKDWNIKTRQPVASYTNVPHGNYIFKVKATNDQGEWSDVLLNLPIHIKPPFWQTWWFLFLTASLIVAAIYSIYQYRIQHIKKIYSVRSKISRDLHDDIGSSLSSINFYSSIAEKEVKKNPTKAEEFLKHINQNSRQIIENISDIVWANNSDQKEKSSLSGRIKNYGYDLLSNNNIECKYSIDEQAEKKLINPEARRNVLLIIKEALNNIAKYSEADFAEVRVMVTGAHLAVDIIDNGKGFDLNLGKNGNGLINMKKRAASLNGHLTIASGKGKGTTIHCQIPLTNISDI